MIRISAVTITHSSVNSGNAVTLLNTAISYSWKNLNNIDPAESSYDIVEMQYKGFENPFITIEGVMDVDDVSSNELTQTLLVDFATLRDTTPISLSITAGTNNTALGGRPSGGYDVSGSNTLSSTVNIGIDAFDLSIDTSSEQAHIWSYSITCHETT